MAALVLRATGRSNLPRSIFGDSMMVLFVAVQVLDGAFTYIGVQIFGPSIEANPLLLWLMHAMGEAPALAAAKAVALTLGAFLHFADVHRVVAALSGLYIGAAIIPWAGLLFF